MVKINTKIKSAMLTAAVLASLSIFGMGQDSTSVAAPTPKPPPKPYRVPALRAAEDGVSTERSIAVVENPSLSLCVNQGNLKVNGWNRNEVRVFVKDGGNIGFKVLQKDSKSQQPVWVKLIGVVTGTPRYPVQNECIWGDEIEIDAPFNTTVKVTGQETDASIDSVKRAGVDIIGGDISVRNVPGGIDAKTYRGSLTVKNSKGAMSLETTTGNIVVFDAGPGEIGDVFKAKTNGGTISLQHVLHRQIDVNSITGSLVFDGAILSGGTYGFTTSNGSIRLSIPQDSSCIVTASYGFGRFTSELPIKIITENYKEGPVKSIVASFGAGGDATLKLVTNVGSIGIKKQ